MSQRTLVGIGIEQSILTVHIAQTAEISCPKT